MENRQSLIPVNSSTRNRGLAAASAVLASEGISMSEVMEKITGGSRTDDQIARDGARLTISQIGKLRRQLDQLERDAQHVVATGRGRKDSAAIWKRVSKAADLLLGAIA